MSPRKEHIFEKHPRLSNPELRSLSNPISEPIDYDPVGFLRCHSRKNDVVDKKTQVWKCAFQPSTGSKNTVFATCGGHSVCVVNAEDGSVKTKYSSKHIDEEFSALAWTSVSTVNESFNILAFAGKKSVLYLFHPDKKICFAAHPLRERAGRYKYINRVESLLYHPEEPNILFGLLTDGSVHVWDVGNPHPPKYKTSLELLTILEADCSANALTFSTLHNMLLCGTNEGVAGWLLSGLGLSKKEKYKDIHFVFPSTEGNLLPEDEDKNVVDSIEALRDGTLIATKCALRGNIYIWDLETAIQLSKTRKPHTSVQGSKKNQILVTPLYTLKWSDTDNFYMTIGINQRDTVLACGDDKGRLWVYDLQEILSSSSKEHDCSKVLDWPMVQDERVVKKMVQYSTSDIVVNQVSLNYDASFLVAVTSTNVVCIWKRVD